MCAAGGSVERCKMLAWLLWAAASGAAGPAVSTAGLCKCADVAVPPRSCQGPAWERPGALFAQCNFLTAPAVPSPAHQGSLQRCHHCASQGEPGSPHGHHPGLPFPAGGQTQEVDLGCPDGVGTTEIVSWTRAFRRKHPRGDPGKVVHIPGTAGSVQFNECN